MRGDSLLQQGLINQRKRIAILACTMLTVASAVAQVPAASRESLAINELVTCLTAMGHGAEAQRLKTEFNTKSKDVSFGTPAGNAQADTKVGTKRTLFNKNALDQIFPSNLNGQPDRKALIDWSTTVIHEFKHQDQDWWAWEGGYWTEFVGRNRCEQQAWGEGFQALYSYARHLQESLGQAPGSREKARLGRELADVCKSYEVYLDSLAARGEIGEVRIENRDGLLVLVASLRDEIKRMGEIGKGSAANADIMLGVRNSVVGTWDVTVRYEHTKRPWTSRGEWILSQNGHSVFGEARMTNASGKMVKGTVRGNLAGDVLRIEVRIGNLIELYEAKVSSDFASATGTTLQSNWAVALVDTYFLGPTGLTGLDGTKIGHMKEEQLRKFQTIHATWKAKVRR